MVGTLPKDDVEAYIEDNEPVEEGEIEQKFGSMGVQAVYELMTEDRVQYTIAMEVEIDG